MTLIEVLLVIALMTCLAGLFLPVLANARGISRQAVCVSNLRQLGEAFTMYVGEWDGYPDSGVYGGSAAGWVYCPVAYGIRPELGALADFVRTPRIYRCPADTVPWTPISYSMNLLVALKREAQIERPADTLLLVEESDQSPRNDACFDPGMAWDRLTDRHSGGGNTLYCDGHARWRFGNTLDRNWGGAWPAAFTGGG